MMQKFLPAMINLNEGSIVSMCSIAGHMGTPYMVPYSASKHGVKGDMIYNLPDKKPTDSIDLLSSSAINK